jgi:hypothetical protein
VNSWFKNSIGDLEYNKKKEDDQVTITCSAGTLGAILQYGIPRTDSDKCSRIIGNPKSNHKYVLVSTCRKDKGQIPVVNRKTAREFPTLKQLFEESKIDYSGNFGKTKELKRLMQCFHTTMLGKDSDYSNNLE